jgi:segregation and condensation protein A
MSHTVAVGQFEGPLGLLLELVERDKLPVSEISVGRITSEYLAKVRELQSASVEDLSEFLQLGARLLYIKSLALLPASSAQEQTLELEQLSLELAEYRRFQAAAKLLAARAATSHTWQRPAAPRLAPGDLPMPALSLEQLAAAFTRALKFAPQATPAAIIKQHLSLETVMSRLQKLLPEGFALESLIQECRDRLEIIVTFLAILELVHSGAARVTQANQFEPIMVEAARG